MAWGFGTTLENAIIDAELRGQSYPASADRYVGLLTCTNGIAARSTAYTVGQTVVVMTGDGTYHLYSCTTAGTTAATAPSYPGTPNEAITDGTAVLTEQSSGLAAGTAAVEPSGGAYARVTVASALASWAGTQGAGTTVASSGTSGQTSNNAAVTFPTSTAAWATAPAMVWGIAIYDAATGGNVRIFGPMSTPQNVGIGATISFSAAQLTATLH